MIPLDKLELVIGMCLGLLLGTFILIGGLILEGRHYGYSKRYDCIPAERLDWNALTKDEDARE